MTAYSSLMSASVSLIRLSDYLYAHKHKYDVYSTVPKMSLDSEALRDASMPIYLSHVDL